MFSLQAIQLFALGPQDRVVTIEQPAYGKPAYERMYYVECVELSKGFVHVITGSGDRRSIKFEDILDIQKNEAPFMVPAHLTGWDAKYHDPSYAGKPVPIVSLDVSKSGRLQSVCVPKWPGQRPGAVRHLYISAHDLGLDEADLFRTLPTNKSIRFYDLEASRSRISRVAGQRIGKYLARALQGSRKLSLPLDPTLKSVGVRFQVPNRSALPASTT